MVSANLALRLLCALLLLAPFAVPAQPAGSGPRSPDRSVLLDRVVAVVNNEAITQHEIDDQKRFVLEQMKAQKMNPPAADVLEKQVTERIITERLMLQIAKGTGIKVDDVQVERTIERIAQENKLTPAEFRNALGREGIPFAKYREDLRNEMLMQKLREREVDQRIQVTDADVDNFLASLAAQSGGDMEYRLAHILVLAPDQGTPEQIDARRRRAEEALKEIQSGADFAQVAASFSDAPDALQGGNLGWRAPARLPSVFAEPVRNMKPGDVSPVLRSASGFHIVKLLETRSRNQPTVVEQTHARHILIKVNEITSEAEAKARIDRIKERLDTGAKFEEQARLNSEDGSSVKGGDLGWLSPGDTVPDFETAMNALKPGVVSNPVRTSFGWHLIEVLDRRTQDITHERQREQARMALRQRKADETFQDWMRQMRDRAYIEYKADEK
ncbi:MAG TPA: peptidylprolyl isomerase [Casimicrobiaceae bacterium]|nr:peptidylprolyl isomerase [Casimicrobiaceae bacterium]